MSTLGERAETPSVARLRRARFAALFVFFAFSAAVADFLARIPQFKEDLDLDDAQLGLALLGSPVGALVAVQLAGTAAGRWGSRRVARVSVIGGCLSLLLPAFAWDLPSLAVGLLVLGGLMGFTDVAANAQGVAIEQQLRRPIMNSLHGGYSLGGLFGALVGSGAAALGITPRVHLSIMAGVLAVAVWVGSRALLGPADDPHVRATETARAPDTTTDADGAPAPAEGGLGRLLAGYRAVVLLALIGLCSFVGEGAVADWSGVHLRETLDSSAGVAGLGFAGMSVAMAAGRFAGDHVVERFGPVRVLRVGALIAALGMTIALVTPWPAVSVLGFTLFGIGVAPVAPVTFSAAGNTPGVPAAWAISRVTGIAYIGLLAGPPVIGFIAHHTSLTTALAIPAVLVAVIALTAGAVRR
ncbi:MFS transporter [Embleya hyalina]|uniref:MFS transporter n=1 Tax=Embleya hyalina TaxID=516124 RepID=A0A401YS84_9ACTN|nr:MFS transporter [Embleya hyalina]GCD97470.1 MFS transporter [Embleya hyalina]